jgi:hypothetical protein
VVSELRKTSVIFSAAAVFAGCQPNLDDTVSVVGARRLLAIQATPAEAAPATDVHYTALIARGEGPDAGPPSLVWDYCNARNPLSNLGPVATSCVQPGGAGLSSFGVGLTASGEIPALACGNFGPNAPPAMVGGADGGSPGQPVDPDSTGGYYQPVSVFLKSRGIDDSIYFARLSCGFAGANEASQGILTARYHLNTNPEVASLSAGGKMLLPHVDGVTNPVARGVKLSLEVAWPACPRVDRCGDDVCGADESAMTCPVDCAPPKGPKGCGGAERYVNFDITSQTVVDQRESIDVAWYGTAGVFDQDRTGRTGTDQATTSEDGWTAPSSSGVVTLWVVLRDARGGVGWAEYALEVK